MSSETNVAFFLDWEGFSKTLEGHYKAKPDVVVLFDAVAEYGNLKVARAYANWQLEEFKSQSQVLKKQGVQSVNVPHDNKERSSSSVKLALDALKLAYKQPQIDTFLLLSGDNSLIPLAHTLKHLKRQVVIIGLEPEMDLRISQQVASSLLIYDRDIVSLEIEKDLSFESISPLEDAFSGIENLLRQAKSKGMSITQLEFVMQHLYDFQPQQTLDIPFKDVMSQMAKAGKVKLFSKGNDVFAASPNFSVGLPSNEVKGTKVEQTSEPKEDSLAEVHESPSLADKEDLMSKEILTFLKVIGEQEKPKKLSEILKILKRRHNLAVGKAFRDEVHRIEKAGYVTLKKAKLGREIFVSKGEKTV